MKNPAKPLMAIPNPGVPRMPRLPYLSENRAASFIDRSSRIWNFP
jgi:hypothetical protein